MATRKEFEVYATGLFGDDYSKLEYLNKMKIKYLAESEEFIRNCK